MHPVRLALLTIAVGLIGGCASWFEEDAGSLQSPDDTAVWRREYGFGYDEHQQPESFDRPEPDPSGAAPPPTTRTPVVQPIVVCRLPMTPELGADTIRRVVQTHESEVRRCYQRALLDDATLEGRVMLRFVIASQGPVIRAHAWSSEFSHPGMMRCVAAAAKRWRFPIPVGVGMTIVNYPYRFAVPDAERGNGRS